MWQRMLTIWTQLSGLKTKELIFGVIIMYIKGDRSGKSEKEWEDYFGKKLDDAALDEKRVERMG